MCEDDKTVLNIIIASAVVAVSLFYLIMKEQVKPEEIEAQKAKYGCVPTKPMKKEDYLND